MLLLAEFFKPDHLSGFWNAIKISNMALFWQMPDNFTPGNKLESPRSESVLD